MLKPLIGKWVRYFIDGFEETANFAVLIEANEVGVLFDTHGNAGSFIFHKWGEIAEISFYIKDQQEFEAEAKERQ